MQLTDILLCARKIVLTQTSPKGVMLMNPPKCDDLDYIHFLIAAQRVFTCTEAARCSPEENHPPVHEAFTRLLQRQPPDTAALWQEARALVKLREGLLILDDTTPDKPYARHMDLVSDHWSGKHQRVVRGIALMTLLWTEGQALILLVYRRQSVPKGIVPCDFRVYDKPQVPKSYVYEASSQTTIRTPGR